MKKLALILLVMLFAVGAWAADVAGTWKSTRETPNGTFEITYVFKVDGDKLTGTISMGQFGEAQISEGKIDGDNISFVVVREYQGNQFKSTYKGKVADKEMKLTATFKTPDGQERTIESTAKKVS